MGLSVALSSQTFTLTVDSMSMDHQHDSAYVGEVVTMWLKSTGTWQANRQLDLIFDNCTVASCIYSHLQADSNFVWRFKVTSLCGIGFHTVYVGAGGGNPPFIIIYYRSINTGINEQEISQTNEYEYFDLLGRQMKEAPVNAYCVRYNRASNERKVVYTIAP